MLFEDDFALSDGESSDNVDAGMRCSLKTTSPSLMARAVTTLMLGCVLFEDDFALSDGESSDNVDAGMRAL